MAQIAVGKDPRKFVLYWSSLAMYENCPRQFLWRKGWADIDLGRGPGKRKKPKKPDSVHNAVPGRVIAKVMEDLYKQELYKHPKTLIKELDRRVRVEFQRQLADPRNHIDWRAPGCMSQADMLQLCLDCTVNYLKTMKHQRLIGQWTRAEYDMAAFIDKYNPIGGKADLVFRRTVEPNIGLTVLDGKASKHKGKYTDPDQVRWYALMFFLTHGVIPDRLGFIYFRYPYGFEHEDGVIDEGIDWIECDKDEHLVPLAKRAKEARRGMMKQKFDPNPVPSYCRFCEFEEECPERMAQKKANSAKRKRKSPGLMGENEFGIMDLDMDEAGSG